MLAVWLWGSLAGCIVDRTYYRLLNLPVFATEAEVRAAFRKLAGQMHPDKDASARDAFRKVNQAYEVLSNSQQRSQYDRYGPDFRQAVANRRQNIGGGFFFHQQQEEPIEPAPMVLRLVLSLAEAYSGGEYEVVADGLRACSHCEGRGTDRPQDFGTCNECGGRGTVQRRVQQFGMIQMFEQHCSRCGGAGTVRKSVCRKCRGSRLSKSTERFLLAVPRGVNSGTQLRIPNGGSETDDGGCSDIVVQVLVRDGGGWTRDGDNLELRLKISLQESILGFSREVEHLDGHRFRVQGKGVSQQGQRVLVAGEGMPRESGGYGRLTVVLQVQIEEFNNRQLDEWELVF